jgi:hypothetical protein
MSGRTETKTRNSKSSPMFKRLMLDDTTAIVTVVAFLTAATIYAAAVWRAFRMKRPQLD